MRVALMGLGLCLVLSGCASKKSSVMLERRSVGPLDEEVAMAAGKPWHIEPTVLTQEQHGVEIAAHPASQEYLTQLFLNKKIFGEFAGKSPFSTDHLVFYVKIANHHTQKIHMSPGAFVLLDERGNQYQTLGVDPLTALAEARQSWGGARGVLSEAKPGYFGIGIPVGSLLKGSQRDFALLKQSALQTGYLYPGVTYDGLVAFWSPRTDTKTLRLILGEIKPDFNAKDEPQASLDFPFEFTAAK